MKTAIEVIANWNGAGIKPVDNEHTRLLVGCMKEYARSVAIQALIDAANNVTATHKGRIVIDKQSILNTNIKLL